MFIYFDTSAILAVILNESCKEAVLEHWEAALGWVTSRLAEIEATVVLKRAATRMPAKVSKVWLPNQLKILAVMLDEVEVCAIDDVIIEKIRAETRFADCRTLDAIHLATAMLFEPYAKGEYRICTLDDRMRAVAARAGLTVAEV